jgi:hypothetical protein
MRNKVVLEEWRLKFRSGVPPTEAVQPDATSLIIIKALVAYQL